MARYFITLCLTLFVFRAYAQQGCPEVSINVVGQDTTLNCCGTLTASYVPNAQTTAYTVAQIPYAPFPFTGGTPVIVNVDDIWSSGIALPFTFCFYGNNYNQFVIGANGIISFNVAQYAGAYCQYLINAAIPSTANPVNSIMGPYHDIDPGVAGNINYQIYGTYPCRILVVNWNQVAMFSCNNLINTQQTVIYETTNVIETYIANKPLCANWNSGQAIHGIQNAAGTLATVVPGRNSATQWTASNDAWRFTPSGGASNVALTWYQVGDTTSLSNTNVLQICPSATTDYVIQAIYDPCVGLPITVYDTITVNVDGNSTLTSTTQTDVLCHGDSTGSAAVTYQTTAPNPLTIWWDPPISTTTSISNVPAGIYTIYLADTFATTATCTLSYTFTIVEPPVLTAATTSVVNVLCNGQATGSIDITPNGGTLPYSFSWNSSPSQSTEDAANLLAGSYNVFVTDAHNCSTAINNIVVTEPTALIVSSITATPATCGNSNGTATVVVAGGNPGYLYTWSTNPTQSTSTIANLAGGLYGVSISDANGCMVNGSVTVPAPIPPTISAASSSNVLCFAGNTGSANITVANGTAPILYNWTPNVSTTNTANNLAAGNYTVIVSDFYNCLDTQSFVITEPPLLTVNIANTNNLCFGNSTAYAVATAGGGTLPYTYSWVTNPSVSDSALNLLAGNYTGYVIDNNNCVISQNFTVTQPTQLVGSATGDTICIGFANGTASVIISGGVQPYNYLWSNGVSTGAAAANLPAGVYLIEVTDGNGCKITQSAEVIASTLPVISDVSIQNVRCFGENNGIITTNIVNGVAPFQYNWSPFVSTTNTAINLSVGQYELLVTDHFNCKDTMQFKVTEPTVFEGTVSAQNVNCYRAKNGRGDITVQGGTLPYTYTWNTNPPKYTHNAVLDTGVYMITAHDANGCTVIDFVSIIEPPRIEVNLVDKVPSYCGLPNGSITMAAFGGTGQLSYSWENNLSFDTMAINIVGDREYTFVVTDQNDCKRSADIYLSDIPRAEAAFITYPYNTEPIFVKDATIHFTNQSKNARSYLWLFGDGLFDVNINPVHKYDLPDSLTAMLIAYNGSNYCPDTAKMDFIILPEGILWFPNVFTPNEDLVNDVYTVKGINVISFQMKIFDRWGKEITTLSSINDVWDGTKNGQDCPEGVYTYVAWGLTLNNEPYKRSGMITLVR